jgi:hypothetical protein
LLAYSRTQGLFSSIKPIGFNKWMKYLEMIIKMLENY